MHSPVFRVLSRPHTPLYPRLSTQDPDPDDDDWDAFLPDEEEAYPEPGDFWIEDDDWEDAA